MVKEKNYDILEVRNKSRVKVGGDNATVLVWQKVWTVKAIRFLDSRVCWASLFLVYGSVCII